MAPLDDGDSEGENPSGGGGGGSVSTGTKEGDLVCLSKGLRVERSARWDFESR
ncbi:hypothetical protein F2Q68_00004655 [Brassica cretica]|uniref:Uncharacterized protein n=1 Tax=Brassica cretica TaxID=69181 RepID=A0A8S9JLQ8_BRACR|nr:hypothetical protein F2Q68_00004655 [Brassica cretica]